MKLLKLYANKPRFKTVVFNEKGLTFILGKKTPKPKGSRKRRTYNGVGKSLIIQLIHFCLASNKVEAFEEKLAGWEFYLDFEINGEKLTSKRVVGGKGIILNEKELTLDSFKNQMEEKVFHLKEIKFVTFRSLLSRFIRPSKTSYQEATNPVSKEKPYASLLNNSILLDIDRNLIEEKYRIKEEKDKIKRLKDNFEKDEVLKDFYRGDKDPVIELNYLESQAEKLDMNLRKFEVAKDYQEIQKQADSIVSDRKSLEKKSFIVTEKIKSIDASMKTQPDISKEKILGLYEQAQVFFSEISLKKIDEVLDFHQTLLENRKNRLREDRKNFENDLKSIELKISNLGNKLDTLLKYLNSHRALDEFVSLSKKLSDQNHRAQKIRDYKSLIDKYEMRGQELKVSMAQENITAQKYLEETKENLDTISKFFRTLSERFYENKTSGLSIVNNDGDNQVRFHIKPKIQDDASDGANEVKIFCYDLLLLCNRVTHDMKLIFHDSRLFSNIDPRQRAILFKLAKEYAEENNSQYIATINEDQVESIQEYLEDEYQQVITDNVVLELTDESADSKLLGIQVDMDYESNLH